MAASAVSEQDLEFQDARSVSTACQASWTHTRRTFAQAVDEACSQPAKPRFRPSPSHVNVRDTFVAHDHRDSQIIPIRNDPKGHAQVTHPDSTAKMPPPPKPNAPPPSEPRIRVTSSGRRYVEPNDMFNDPVVRDRLRKADGLATELGIKGGA